ncbi:MAG: hypothetical protein JEZ08_16500 [Clostridiales bacterium]|nr:hypothetical protein [Clostridiales bacterium]
MVQKINLEKAKEVAKKTSKKAVVKSARSAKETKKTIKDASDASKKKSKKDKSPKIVKHGPNDLRSLLAPDGANPLSANHIEIIDNGKSFFSRSFYISVLPKRGKFAETFEDLFKFRNCNATVYIDPINTAEAITKLDNNLTTIEAEQLDAMDKHDTNRVRKLRGKYQEAEFFQKTLEGRENKSFDVSFVFSLTENNLEELDRRTSEFVFKARDNGIELTSFYANQEMAYKLNKPFNIKQVSGFATNLLVGIKSHPMDLYSLSTIFAHTSTEFYHENGLVIGRNILTGGHPVAYDVYDKSHRNQNVFFAGASGSGKSATIKKLMRLLATICDHKFVVLDVENIKGRGEFSDIVDELGGYRFELKPDSDKIINPFEISDEEVYNVETNSYKKTLKLVEKLPYTSNIILSLNSGNKPVAQSNVLERIVNDIVLSLYKGTGLVEGDPESLYNTENVVSDGKMQVLRKKKTLPTLSDFVILAVQKKLKNEEPVYHNEYINLIAGLSNYVKEINICEFGCGKVYTSKEVIENKGVCSCNKDISTMIGAFNFFDGQTTSDDELTFDNFPIISIDVSNVPAEYLSKAMLTGLNFIMETIIKRNSENAETAKRVSLVNDEQHKTFHLEANRAIITTSARILRKRNAGLWSITQSINDYTLYDDTKTIVTQSDSAFIFKHKNADRKSLKLLLDDVNESDLNFITSARIGEVFLSDAAGKARIKIDLLPIEMDFANTNLELEKKRKAI